MRKPAFCICQNKDADKVRGNPEAVQRLKFVFATRIVQFPSYLKSKFQPLAVQPGLCRNWSETLKIGFLTTRLIWWKSCCMAELKLITTEMSYKHKKNSCQIMKVFS